MELVTVRSGPKIGKVLDWNKDTWDMSLFGLS